MQTVAGDPSQPQSKWTELPQDLLIILIKLLSTNRSTAISCKHQILRFRAVCKPWRSALPLNNTTYDDSPLSLNVPLPVLAPPAHFDYVPSAYPYNLGMEPKGSFYIVQSTAYILDSVENPLSSHFIVVDHLSDRESGKVHCRNPLSVSHDRSSAWDVDCRRTINLLDYRVSVVSENYSLRYLVFEDGSFRLPVSCENFCKKALLFWNPKLKDRSDGIALVLFDGGKLGLYSFKDRKWETVYDGKNNSKCSDIATSKSGGIIIDHKANAYCFKYDFPSRSLVQKHFVNEIVGSRLRRKRLVLKPSGGLYMIAQDANQLSFTTYMIEGRKWKSMKPWGAPGILLVGLDFSCFVKPGDFGCLKKDVPFLRLISMTCLFYNKRSFPLYQGRNVNIEKGLDRVGDHELCVDDFAGLPRAVFGPCKEDERDYSSIFSSPSKWSELTPPPPTLPFQPHCLIFSGNVHNDISQGKIKAAEKGKGKRAADDPNDSEPSEGPCSKSRKMTHSQPAGGYSEEEVGALLGSIEKFLVALTRFISNTIKAQPDPPGYSFHQVMQDLGLLPGVEIGSEFYFSAAHLLQKKEHRELYMYLPDADIKYKWLKYMCDRFKP